MEIETSFRETKSAKHKYPDCPEKKWLEIAEPSNMKNVKTLLKSQDIREEQCKNWGVFFGSVSNVKTHQLKTKPGKKNFLKNFLAALFSQ